MTIKRCPWCGDDELYTAYHDNEWGIPIYDSQQLFEFLVLEGMQAGLSWITILRKRPDFYKAFANLDPHKMARFSQTKVEKLLQNPNIIRNRLKVEGAIKNAKAYLIVEKSEGFSDFVWQFVEGEPIQNKWRTLGKVPAKTMESEQMSKALKQRGFTFVGPTICYAFMQAVGMVNDHLLSCYRHAELA